MEIRFDDRVFPCLSEQALRILRVYAESPGVWFTDKQVAGVKGSLVTLGKVCVNKKKAAARDTGST